MVVSRFRTIALGNDDITLGGAEFEKINSLPILGITLDSEFTFGVHLRELMSKQP